MTDRQKEICDRFEEVLLHGLNNNNLEEEHRDFAQGYSAFTEALVRIERLKQMSFENAMPEVPDSILPVSGS